MKQIHPDQKKALKHAAINYLQNHFTIEDLKEFYQEVNVVRIANEYIKNYFVFDKELNYTNYRTFFTQVLNNKL